MAPPGESVPPSEAAVAPVSRLVSLDAPTGFSAASGPGAAARPYKELLQAPPLPHNPKRGQPGTTADTNGASSEQEGSLTPDLQDEHRLSLPDYGDGSFLSRLPARSGPAEATTVLPPPPRIAVGEGIPPSSRDTSGADWQALEGRMMDALVTEVMGQVMRGPAFAPCKNHPP